MLAKSYTETNPHPSDYYFDTGKEWFKLVYPSIMAWLISNPLD